MKDFGAHSNYCELALRELGFNNVFAHTGSQTKMQLRGKSVFPLVTGTFGAVDFLHSGNLLTSGLLSKLIYLSQCWEKLPIISLRLK